jgi:hypothetical protein
MAGHRTIASFGIFELDLTNRELRKAALRFYRFSDGSTRDVAPMREGSWGMTIAPDGRSLLFAIRSTWQRRDVD